MSFFSFFFRNTPVQPQRPSQAKAFLALNASQAYEDATTEGFWQKAGKEANVTNRGARFPDGSEILFDAMGCSLTAT